MNKEDKENEENEELIHFKFSHIFTWYQTDLINFHQIIKDDYHKEDLLFRKNCII